MALEKHRTKLVEESEQQYADTMEKKMLEKSYTTNDFNDVHYKEKETAMRLVTITL